MLPTRLQGLSASRRLICFFSSLIVFKESRSLRTCTQYARVRFRPGGGGGGGKKTL